MKARAVRSFPILATLLLAALAAARSAGAQSCTEAPLRMAESFPANIVECGGSWNRNIVEARGDHFKLHLEFLRGNFWYQPVKAYFQDASGFDGTSDWGDEEDAGRRFDYATFRGDLVNDHAGVLSCVAITRHSSPYEGRGAIARHLVVGIYCDDSYGDGPVPEARINQVIDAIEFDFE
jgi:hypothetical protein